MPTPKIEPLPYVLFRPDTNLGFHPPTGQTVVSDSLGRAWVIDITKGVARRVNFVEDNKENEGEFTPNHNHKD